MADLDTGKNEALRERPWIKWETTYEIETWMDGYNRDLQQCIKKTNASGYGICFILEGGGEIFMDTTSEGDVLLDVTPEAEWVTPVIIAATQVETSPSRLWTLPGNKLTQLVLGLSSLISSTRMVLSHEFKIKKY
jgi:hypothetical protein